MLDLRGTEIDPTKITSILFYPDSDHIAVGVQKHDEHSIEVAVANHLVAASPENFAALGEYFLGLALGQIPTPGDPHPTDPDGVAQSLLMTLHTNIAGVSESERRAIQAATPVVARTIHRLAEYVDTAMTGDTAS